MIHLHHRQKPVQKSDTTRIFVSLYLILLAFFAVLNVISNQVAAKTGAAMESVNSTFKKPFPDFSNRLDPQDDGKTGAHNDFVSSLKGAFSAEIELDGRFGTLGGRVVQFEVPVEMFFASDHVRVKADKLPLVDHLAALIASAPKGYRREVAFMFGSGRDLVDPRFLRSQALSSRRAGSLARLLALRGFGDGTYATGFVPADNKTLIILFRTIPEAMARVSLVEHSSTGPAGEGV